MFPITPTILGPGTVIGVERTITKASGGYCWKCTPDEKLVAFVYDREGFLVRTQRATGRITLELSTGDGQIAVVAPDDGPGNVRTVLKTDDLQADFCLFTVDAGTGQGFQKGVLRGGAYFHAVTPATDPAASASVAGCAALCCTTDGCVAWSLNAPWSLGSSPGNCQHGQNCCSLAATRGAFVSNVYPMNITTGVVQAAPSTGKPPGVTKTFDCAVRTLAYEYAKTLRPDRGAFRVVHDGLQLSGCGVPLAGALAPAPPASTTAPTEFFVSLNGSNSASGTLAKPFASPQHGVTACRQHTPTGAPCTVTLRGGTYYLSDSPVQLTAADSGLTLRGYRGESAELSGGEPLPGLAWTRAHTPGRNDTAPVWVAPFRSVGELTALRVRATGRRVQRARHPNADPETIGARRTGDINEGWLPAMGAEWTQAPPGPTPGQDFVSSAIDWPGLDWSHHLQMDGGNFTIGYGGGRCDDMASKVGYWCGVHIPRGDQFVHGGPGGLLNPEAVLPHYPYADPKGLVVHMWAGCGPTCNRIGPWFTLQWQVGGVGANGSLDFAAGGGTQGSEGWKVDGPTGAWFVENALELLDDENEFFHDTASQLLYWAPNVSGTTSATEPPDADALIAVCGKVLLSVAGSQTHPAKNISVVGLVFRDAAPTFLDSHDQPSQGDWSLVRSLLFIVRLFCDCFATVLRLIWAYFDEQVHTAAVVANGTEGFTFDNNLVTRVDGQGLLLEGYHRDARILRNDFEWMCDFY